MLLQLSVEPNIFTATFVREAYVTANLQIITIRDGDTGFEIPFNLLQNGEAIDETDVESATLLVRVGNEVVEIELDYGASTVFQDQWIGELTTELFTDLGTGQFYAEVLVVFNASAGQVTLPTDGGLRLHILKKLTVPEPEE